MLLRCDLARATRGAGTRGHGLSSWVRLPPSRVSVGCMQFASDRGSRHTLVSAIKCKGNRAAAVLSAVLRLGVCQCAKVSGTRWRACAGRGRRGVVLRVHHTLAAHTNANAATAELPPAGQSLRANMIRPQKIFRGFYEIDKRWPDISNFAADRALVRSLCKSGKLRRNAPGLSN